MELKTLDDPDLRMVTLAALDSFEKCLSNGEQELKKAAQTVYKEIAHKSANIDPQKIHKIF